MTSQSPKSAAWHVTLWILQGLLALFYIGTGIFKLVMPLATLAALWPWAGEYPTLLRFTGTTDLLGGFGLVLPALTRLRPGLTVVAALGVAALQVGAIAFHLSRGEGANTMLNFGLLALALLVFWGRRGKAPLAPRQARQLPA